MIKKYIIKLLYSFSITSSFLEKRNLKRLKRCTYIDPCLLANEVYKREFSKDINWDAPKNLIEKIYWLEIFSDTSLWSICADKYNVREYVTKKGCADILNKLYGRWDDPSDINYDKLPNEFVLKTTNGCGQVLVVKDKSQLNIRETNNLLSKWMDLKYGYDDGQIHYSRIKPCIIAERFLTHEIDDNRSLVDYKIWCFNGIPEYILVVYNRVILGKHKGYLLSAYDLDWNNISDKVLKHGNVHYDGTNIPKPQNLDIMLEKASRLSADFLEVRVDFYEVNNKVIFGELTFSTGYGYHKESFYDYLGSKIDLSKARRIEGKNYPPKFD